MRRSKNKSSKSSSSSTADLVPSAVPKSMPCRCRYLIELRQAGGSAALPFSLPRAQRCFKSVDGGSSKPVSGVPAPNWGAECRATSRIYKDDRIPSHRLDFLRSIPYSILFPTPTQDMKQISNTYALTALGCIGGLLFGFDIGMQGTG